jgi:hypothetical protein
VSDRPTPAELLATPGAVVGREHLRALGLSEYDVDRLMQSCGVIVLPGIRRTYVDAAAARGYLEERRR